MKIATIGRGNVGGGLAKLWRDAGHDVTELGSDGGDASGTDVVLIATPFDAVAAALSEVSGIEAQVVIDATNRIGTGPPEGFASGAEHVKSLTGTPVAKSFNLNFATLYDEVDKQSKPPGNLYCADEDAREVTEQLIRDAGYEPVNAGGLESAAAVEDAIALWFALAKANGQGFYRFAPPGAL